MSSEIRLSVLIPTRNRCAFLREALESVFASLPLNSEVIVSDNASSDGTEQLLEEFSRKFNLRVLRQLGDLGMVGNWNAALQAARGRYVKLLCDDDVLFPGALERELNALERDNKIVLSASGILEIPSAVFSLPIEQRERFAVQVKKVSNALELTEVEALRRMFFRENIFGTPSAVMFRKSALDRFPSQYQYATDWMAWVEIMKKGRAKILPELGCCFRLHEKSFTVESIFRGIDLLEVIQIRRGIYKRLKELNADTRGYAIYLRFIILYRLVRRSLRLCVHAQPGKILPLAKRVLNG